MDIPEKSGDMGRPDGVGIRGNRKGDLAKCADDKVRFESSLTLQTN